MSDNAVDTAAPLVVVRPHPLCAETPMTVLAQPVTPPESVYVRSNFPNPELDRAHRISVGGAVRASYEIGLEELAAMPQHEVLVTLECAGNWRLGMDPVPTGEPWEYGALSTTRWSGVRLGALLERAGVDASALEVLATGADSGPREDEAGIVQFQRALPIAAAMAPDTIVATHMDGAPLTMDHGAPMRLIVPGWYGMASVKWLTTLELITTPFTGYFQHKRYVFDTPDGIVPVTQALVKSMITAPGDGSTSAHDTVVQGWAWSGAGAITRVDVQVNDGVWLTAELGAPESKWAWTPFTCAVVLPQGAVTLRSRAADATGAEQPERIVWNRLGYGNNAIRAITVTVH